jgi:CHASE2 domain-containing sensor protein
VKIKGVRQSEFLKSALGAALTILCGLMLWKTPPGEPWVNASYDYLFGFGAPAVTNKIALILMDNAAFDQFHQPRGQPWDRALHARLLNKLADDGAKLVVFDSFFRATNDPAKDAALANAMRRQRHIVLMAEQSQVTLPGVAGAQPTLPAEPFLSAAGTNWGVANLDPDSAHDSIVRRHWPFPSPGPYPSLPETAAKLAGARLSDVPQEKWLRYYGQDNAWTKLSYQFALTQPANYFRDQIVFIGTEPQSSVPDIGEPEDKFRTPYTRLTGEASGGVEIMLTSFLNLVNGDWLRRPIWWAELLALVVSGTLLGGGLCRMRLLTAGISTIVVVVVIALGAICWSYFTNYWFPWLIVAGGQAPCALAWAAGIKIYRAQKSVALSRRAAEVIEKLPDIPGYELFNPPFGEGAYGKVWLARNAQGQWRALKVIYLAKFGEDLDPYEREFNGINKYKPVSDRHPGLLRVDFVSEKLDGYFYYVMELGDPLDAGWEHEPSTYKPRDLVSERVRSQGSRLPVRECIRIGLALTDALDFLHQNGLTHRDIKPQNIIFVNGHPKLADMGLIAEIRPLNLERTIIGTPGYMPPPPERPGTPEADIYALGMVLYVLSTGRGAAFFPEIATSLVAADEPVDFFPLNNIILKACQPDPAKRYASASEMHRALLDMRGFAANK